MITDCHIHIHPMEMLRSGALEFATMPGAVLSTLIPTASLTGVGFAFTDYGKVWAAMDGEVGNFIRRAKPHYCRTAKSASPSKG